MIELLVVISVIGILAAILLPVLAQVRERSYVATCTNNLRQIGHALDLYRQARNGKFPIAAGKPSSSPGLASLRDALVADAPDAELWRCPADPDQYATEGLSYEWNSFLSGLVLNESVLFTVFATRNAAKVPLVYDFEKVHSDGAARVVLFADGHAKLVEE